MPSVDILIVVLMIGVLNNVGLLSVILQNAILPNVTVQGDYHSTERQSVEWGSAHCHSAENHLR